MPSTATIRMRGIVSQDLDLPFSVISSGRSMISIFSASGCSSIVFAIADCCLPFCIRTYSVAVSPCPMRFNSATTLMALQYIARLAPCMALAGQGTTLLRLVPTKPAVRNCIDLLDAISSLSEQFPSAGVARFRCRWSDRAKMGVHHPRPTDPRGKGVPRSIPMPTFAYLCDHCLNLPKFPLNIQYTCIVKLIYTPERSNERNRPTGCSQPGPESRSYATHYCRQMP